MTAQELHDLYTPLWARVPETRPSLLMFDPEFVGRFHRTRGSTTKYWVLDDEAAALCRVAVEDWLLSNNRSLFIYAGDGPRRIHVRAADDDAESPDWTEYEGPTIHHALVACVMTPAEKSV